VIVDAKPTRAVKQSKKAGFTDERRPKPGGPPVHLVANMQRRVEEMRDEAERNRTKK